MHYTKFATGGCIVISPPNVVCVTTQSTLPCKILTTSHDLFHVIGLLLQKCYEKNVRAYDVVW